MERVHYWHEQGRRAQVTAWSGGPDPKSSSATITLPLSQCTLWLHGVLCGQLMEKECKKLSLVHECVVLICNCKRKWTAAVLKPYSGVTLKSPISGNSLYKYSFKWCTLSTMWVIYYFQAGWSIHCHSELSGHHPLFWLHSIHCLKSYFYLFSCLYLIIFSWSILGKIFITASIHVIPHFYEFLLYLLSMLLI